VRLFFLTLFFLPSILVANPFGDKDKRDSLRRYHNTVDTNFIRKFPDRFMVTLSQSYRQYDVRYSQTLTHDPFAFAKTSMIADANLSTGLSVDFDKISFSFGIRSKPPDTATARKHGSTDYTSFSLSFSAWRFRFETSYRRYNGFYDYNTPAYDTNFKHTGVYFQNPDMNVRSVRAKTIFIFNKRKFSYSAAFFNTSRQLKSAGSFLLVSNIYDYQFTAPGSLIPDSAQQFFGQYGDLNYFRVQGISIGPGYSFTLVLWKTLYLNTTLTSGFDFQHRTYDTKSQFYRAKYWDVGAAGDARFALGLNGKRMFASVTFRVDYNSYLTDGFRIEPRFKSLDFNFGYRFRFKERKWVKWMKQNKWYQMF
jgi:hypothetical protein